MSKNQNEKAINVTPEQRAQIEYELLNSVYYFGDPTSTHKAVLEAIERCACEDGQKSDK